MEIRELRTVAQVIDTVGSLRVQQVTKRRSNNLTNWKSSGRFPPFTFLVLRHELARQNCSAPARLWGIVEPRSQRAA